MNAMYWLILFIVLLIIEIVTLGLTTIWFAGGALVSFILAMLNVPVGIQWAVFCIVSLLLLLSTRPWAIRYFNNQKREKTNVDSLLGRTVVVTEEIHNLEGRGEAQINGLTWMARTREEGAVIPEGAHAVVLAVEGAKLIVEEKREG